VAREWIGCSHQKFRQTTDSYNDRFIKQGVTLGKWVSKIEARKSDITAVDIEKVYLMFSPMNGKKKHSYIDHCEILEH
jgi:hypothetical protein